MDVSGARLGLFPFGEKKKTFMAPDLYGAYNGGKE